MRVDSEKKSPKNVDKIEENEKFSVFGIKKELNLMK